MSNQLPSFLEDQTAFLQTRVHAPVLSSDGVMFAAAAAVLQLGQTEDESESQEAVENLLESYFMQIDSTHDRLDAIGEFIEDTEEYINIELDSSRNRLLRLEIVLTAGTFGITMFSLVAGAHCGCLCYIGGQQRPSLGAVGAPWCRLILHPKPRNTAARCLWDLARRALRRFAVATTGYHRVQRLACGIHVF